MFSIDSISNIFSIASNQVKDKVSIFTDEQHAELSLYDIHGIQILQKRISK